MIRVVVDGGIDWSAVAGMAGVIALIVITEALAVRRRRREGSAALMILLVDVTTAISKATSLRAGAPIDHAQFKAIFEKDTLNKYVRELENRLTVSQFEMIAMRMMVADLVARQEGLLAASLVIERQLVPVNELLRLRLQLSADTLPWLRHPRAYREARRRVREIMAVERQTTDEAVAALT
ncbi:MAG: hypothetical protein WCI61_05240 [Chloroflexota bacterium]